MLAAAAPASASPITTGVPEAVIAVTDYGAPITAAVAKDNVWGCQFHPEKSGPAGLALLRAFCEV